MKKNYKKIDVNALQFQNCCGGAAFNATGKDFNEATGNIDDVVQLSTYQMYEGKVKAGSDVPDFDTMTEEEIRQYKNTQRLENIRQGYATGGTILDNLINLRDSIINPSVTPTDGTKLSAEQDLDEKKKKRNKIIVGSIVGAAVITGIVLLIKKYN